MSAYNSYHPMRKQANRITELPSAFLKFLQENQKALRTKLQTMRKPGYLKNVVKDAVKNNIPEIIGGTIGLAGGAYMGNQAFNNSLPPVRALPNLDQSPYIETERPYGNMQ